MSLNDFKSGLLLDSNNTNNYTDIMAFNPSVDKITDTNIMLKIPEKQIILDQGLTYSCVAHSLCMCESIIQYNRTNKWIDFDPYVTYGTIVGDQHDGYGMYPLEAIENCVREGFYFKRDFGKIGDRPEIRYEVENFKSKNPDLVKQAKDYAFSGKADIFDVNGVKRALKAGMPVSAGWKLYDSFMSVKNDGKVPVPQLDREQWIGNHQMTIIGIRDDNSYIVVNSYGEQYGFKGIYFIPFNYRFVQAYAISDTIIPTKRKASIISAKIGDNNVYVDDCIEISDVAPMIVNDITMVPIRLITEALGASVEWIPDTEEIIIRSEEEVIRMIVGKTSYWTANDNIHQMDNPPMIVNDITIVPLRVVSETLNCKVEWDQSNQEITIRCL